MTSIELYTKLSSLPDHLKKEVEDFMEFLKSKDKSEKQVGIQRRAGLAKGLIQMGKGFDEPLDDFSQYIK